MPPHAEDPVDLVNAWAREMGFASQEYRDLPCSIQITYARDFLDHTTEFEGHLDDTIEADDENQLQSDHEFGPSEDWTLKPPNSYVEQQRWRNGIRSAYRLKAWNLHIDFIGLFLCDDQGARIDSRLVYLDRSSPDSTTEEIEEFFRSHDEATRCTCLVGVEKGAGQPEPVRYMLNSRAFLETDDRGRLVPSAPVLEQGVAPPPLLSMSRILAASKAAARRPR